MSKIADQLAQKTYQELDRLKKLEKQPQSRSRVSQSPNAYIHLIPWSNASLLRILTVKWLQWLKSYLPAQAGNHKLGFKLMDRLEAQLADAARSVVANIEEGFARPTTKEYLNFLGYSQASLKEVKGDIQRAHQDKLLKSKPTSSLKNVSIDLKDWHEALKKSVISTPSLKSSKLPLNSSKLTYPPLEKLVANNLTLEIFIELINKTDWHLRRLVESLEKKLLSERKGYQIQKARIRDNLT